jgi:hypothetical protein
MSINKRGKQYKKVSMRTEKKRHKVRVLESKKEEAARRREEQIAEQRHLMVIYSSLFD